MEQTFTVSIGMTWLDGAHDPERSPGQVIERADAALYAAKQAGRGTAAFLEL